MCKIEHNNNFGAGRFCSRSCACKYSSIINSKNKNLKISKALLEYNNKKEKKIYKHVCEQCNNEFETNKIIRKNRPKHCINCKRVVIHKKNIKDCDSIMQLAKRTIAKILKRANICCSICGWDKTSLDMHHIIPKSKNGTNEHSNLIALCPNCHRLAHENKIDKEKLIENNLTLRFANWKEFYAISNC